MTIMKIEFLLFLMIFTVSGFANAGTCKDSKNENSNAQAAVFTYDTFDIATRSAKKPRDFNTVLAMSSSAGAMSPVTSTDSMIIECYCLNGLLYLEIRNECVPVGPC
jgi:hypothetical protein